MANEEALRRKAVEMHREGKKPSKIAREIGKSRQWVYKWVNRSKVGEEGWYESHSHAPHESRTKTSSAKEEKIVEARQHLTESPYMEAGAYAIWHYMDSLGEKPPSVATINRILSKHGLTNKKVKYQKSGIEYPSIPEDTQIMDLIGPRYLRGGRRFYMLDIISNDSRHAGAFPMLSKSGENITKSVTEFWKQYSVPEYLQMDNELSFKGSNRHPRGLGILIRTALELNVTPVFIPVSEPWRNGVVERFNQHVERTLLMQEHRDFDELVAHSKEFTEQHNHGHHYSTLGHKTPEELDKELAYPLEPLDENYAVSVRPGLVMLCRNEIRFIRLVRSDLKINILNTEITVDERLMYTYVEALLYVNEHVLLIRQDGKIVQRFEFIMPLI